MLRSLNWSYIFKTGALAALGFLLMAVIYIAKADYSNSWLLYAGSFLFMIAISFRLIRFSGSIKETSRKVIHSHAATLFGILISVLGSFFLLSVMVHGYLRPGNTAIQLADAPVQTVRDKTGGLSFDLFMAATIINFSVGSFSSIIWPFYMNRKEPGKNG